MASAHRLGLGRAAARTLAVATSLVAAGCTLVQPGCRNRDVRSTIEKEARESVDFTMATSQQSPLSPETPFALIEPIETSRHDNTRSCSAKIAIGTEPNSLTVPIEYEVTGGEGGEAFYSWNKDEFGQAFIGTTMLSMLQKLGSPTTDGSRDPSSDDHATPQQPDADASAADTEASQRESLKREQLKFDRWHDGVTAAINAQASNFRIEGSGSVSLVFSVSAAGSLSDVRVVRGSGNAELDRIAVQMVEKTARVRSPPDRKAMSFTMKISFL